jgi:hypothetical protein
MGEIFGAAGSIVSAKMQADATKEATQMQLDALEQQRNFVFKNLRPSRVNEAARAADIERAESRLALQAQLDPALLATRYISQNKLLELAQEGAESQGDVVAAKLFGETMKEEPRLELLRGKLLDTALDEIDQGASLPPDVQAELVKAGLERSGTVGTGSSSRGLAGQFTRKLIGSEALNLKKARQDQAVRLGLAAEDISSRRLGILGSVFPSLKNLQTQNIQQQQSALGTANQLVPEAGLGGSDIANVFLARVGATNQIAQSAADVAARGSLQQAQALQQMVGGITSAGQGLAKGISQGVSGGQDYTSTAGIASAIFGG